jgi:hypothetical protein
MCAFSLILMSVSLSISSLRKCEFNVVRNNCHLMVSEFGMKGSVACRLILI